MNENGHDSPEHAAMTGFPEEHCRVISSRSLADDAYVLLDTGSPGQPYLYGVNCHRTDGQWFEGCSGNGPGWAQTGNDPDLGTLSLWGDAPQGVDCVRVVFDGVTIDEPVHHGAYLFVWWRVPCPKRWPHVVATRAKGIWTPDSDFGLALRVTAERNYRGGGTG
jgi:hypothetical protein